MSGRFVTTLGILLDLFAARDVTAQRASETEIGRLAAIIMETHFMIFASIGKARFLLYR
jgi:hypothetical protein